MERYRGRGGYDVGYGKPPRESRFKTGQSGNPKGRPKGVRNFKSDLKATLKAPVRLTQEGKPRQISTQRAALLRLRERALSGDPRALDRLLALAQTYDDGEASEPATASSEDRVLIEIFRRRVADGTI